MNSRTIFTPVQIERFLYYSEIIALFACLLLFIAALMISPASAATINPSVENQPWQCKYSVIKDFFCPDKQPGPQGPQGQPGQNNFSAIFFNSSNFTASQNNATFFNSTNFTANSNTSIFYGATITNVSGAINESYAYLPGRAGGQTLNGGSAANDDLILSGTSSATKTTSRVILAPSGDSVIIGSGDNSTNFMLDVWASNALEIGADNNLRSRTSGVTKVARMVMPEYSGSSSSVAILFNGQTNPTQNLVMYGGGTLNGYGATELQFYTAPNVTTPSGNLRAVINTNGYFGLGISAPSTQFDMSGNARIRGLGAGTVTADANGVLTSVSDAKAKTKINSIPTGMAITQIKGLNPVCYHYSVESGLDTANEYCGFIAGEVKKIIPSAVKTKQDVTYEQKLKTKGKTADEDEYETIEKPTGTTTDSLDDRAIIAVMVNAIKEQQQQIEAQQKQIDELKTRIDKAGIK